MRLSPTEVGRLLGSADSAFADEVHAATAGHPDLVRLASRLFPHGDVVTALAPHVAVPPDPLVLRFAHLGPVHPDLGASPDEIDDLVRCGLLTPHGSCFRLVPLIAAAARSLSTLDVADALVAASWYARNGEPAAAVRLYQRLEQHRCAMAVLSERGSDILAADGPRALLDLLSSVPTTALRTLRDTAQAMLGSPGEQLYREARYREAAAEAERAGAMTIWGAALAKLGHLDEALARLSRAASLGSAAAWGHLGDVHRLRGRTASARAAYQSAPDDPRAQAGLAVLDGASRCGPLVQGLVALASGDRAAAASFADAAVTAARCDRAALAEALELTAASTDDQVAASQALTEALSIWRTAGARVDAARVTVLLGELPGATVPQRVAARDARAYLASLDVLLPARQAPVEIRTLGRFEVLVDGSPVPTSAWQSRKAKDLLRILVARRGRGIAREELAALLWDDDSGKVGHRLSVALSTVRTVLDPHKLLPSDHYVRATQTSVALDTTRISIDLEDFLGEAAHGLRSANEPILRHAEEAYTGDLFEDDPYDDWAAPLREEVRATYLRVVRALAESRRSDGDTDGAVRYLHRLLAADPYDEQAHLDLVDTLRTAGCHGQANRADARYRAAMADC